MKLPALSSLITSIALASVCTLSLVQTAAAFDATATRAVNVRSGPGVSNSKVDVLSSGEAVDITECQGGWCYVEHSGPDGWVSGRYLRAQEDASSGQSSNQQMDPAVAAILGAIVGAIINEALDNDDPTPTPTPPTPTPPTPTAAKNYTGLYLYYSGERGDNFSTATIRGIQDATRAGYGLVRKQGCVLTEQHPDTVPLNLYWHAGRGDNFTTATGAGDAQAAGYQFVRTVGYIYRSPNGNRKPLRLHWSAARGDNFISSTSQGATAAQVANYRSVRTEGYIAKSSFCD